MSGHIRKCNTATLGQTNSSVGPYSQRHRDNRCNPIISRSNAPPKSLFKIVSRGHNFLLHEAKAGVCTF
jgi:hypothetical protein